MPWPGLAWLRYDGIGDGPGIAGVRVALAGLEERVRHGGSHDHVLERLERVSDAVILTQVSEN